MTRVLRKGILLIGAALTVSQLTYASSTPERLVFDGNVLFNNLSNFGSGAGVCTTSVSPLTTISFTAQDLATVYFTHNKINLDPKLVGPYNLNSPRWDPQQSSPVLCNYTGDAFVLDAGAIDPWFEKTAYAGAIDYRLLDPTQDWTTGWIYTNTAGGLGRTDINLAKPLVILSGPQTSSATLSASNNYLLRGKVNWVNGTTLTIPAGTYLFGERATTGYLVIDRGARIFVNGTKAAPVVLTSDQDFTSGLQAPGDNGGLVLHGRAVSNCANTAAGDSCTSEGGAGFFGGGDDNDNSGSIKYMRIEYSGKEIAPDNELNSLTMNAVGRNTQIEYVQAHMGSDDAFEWFGGTARIKHVIGTGMDDDGLDWQLGYRGFVQFAVIQQYPNRGDKGTEADNSEFNFAAPNRSNPVLSNITYVGTNPPTPGAGASNIGVHLRRGTGGTVINSIILGFRGPALTLSDPETFANCPGTAPAVLCNPVVTAVETQNTPLNRGIVMVASPNPFGASTNILFGMPVDRSRVKARVYNAQGRLVSTLYDGPLSRGSHTVSWTPPSSLPAGAYFFRVESEGGLSTNGKLVVVR